MRNFTLQQVRGKASAVLNAYDCGGRVCITQDSGKSYVIERIKRPAKQRRTALAKSIAEARREFKSGKPRPATPSEIVRKILA